MDSINHVQIYFYKIKVTMNQYKTACGGTINVSQKAKIHLEAHPNVFEHLREAIERIHFPVSRKKIECEIDMGRLIGRSGVVKTVPVLGSERAKFALRANRKQPSRVSDTEKFGDETSRIVVIARPTPLETQYDLITAWIGTLAKKEPWDASIGERTEFRECLNYWSSRALVYDPSTMGPVFDSSWTEVLSLGQCRFL